MKDEILLARSLKIVIKKMALSGMHFVCAR